MSSDQTPPVNATIASPAPAWPPGAGVPAGLRGWMTFVAVMMILSGVLGVLSCFGLVNGILTIVAGVALLGARGALDGMRATDPATWQFLAKLRTCMVATAWTYLIGLIFVLIAILLWGGAIWAAILTRGMVPR